MHFRHRQTDGQTDGHWHRSCSVVCYDFWLHADMTWALAMSKNFLKTVMFWLNVSRKSSEARIRRVPNASCCKRPQVIGLAYHSISRMQCSIGVRLTRRLHRFWDDDGRRSAKHHIFHIPNTSSPCAIRDHTIGFGMQIARTKIPTFSVMCIFPVFVALCDHQRYRRMKWHT